MYKTMKMSTKKRAAVLALSVLCFAAAILILIFMPRADDKAIELPPANFTVEKGGAEINDPFKMIIRFPRLSPKDGEGDFDDVNLLMRNFEKDYFYQTDLPYQEGDVASYTIIDLDIDLAAGDFLSYTVEGLYMNGSYADRILHSVNINAATGEMYTFSDVVIDNEKFQKAFANGKFTPVDPPSDEVTKSSVEILRNFSPAYSIYPDVYFENGNFGVIAKAPNVYGYVKFTIPMKDAIKFLNTDNPLVKFLTEGI